MNESPVVLGAGLAGLGCALHLPGARIYESASHPGGHIWSHTLGGATFDEGAHICHSKDESWLKSLFAQAGDVVHMPTSRVANWWHGHWVTYPVQNHLNELPMEARAAALTGFVQAQGRHAGKTPANYDEWCRFQYGDYLADHFYKEYTDKYWRVSMAELGTDWLAGRLLPSQVERIVRGALQHQEEQQSVFASFHYPARGGFYSFFKDYYKQVPIELGCRAVGLDVAAVDLASLGNPAFLSQCPQDAGPDAPAAPPVPAVVDGCRSAVFGRAIRPAATALEHVNDAGDHPTVIDPARSGLVLWQVRLDHHPCFIRQPKQRHANLHDSRRM